MAEEYEVEEGEIYDDADTLAYIDEKLESVLGDFMKDFGGSISVENLGPRFGVYGSFLPTYRRPTSVLFQPATPQKSGTSTVPYRDEDSRFSVQESNQFLVKHEVSIIRVGSDKTARKSTDLSTVLGVMNSSTESVEVSSKFRKIPSDSRTTILHTMTSSVECGKNNCCSSESERDTSGAVCLRKKDVKRDKPEPPVSPFIIEGDWILCDKCRKGRLLPYGTKPEQLSQSWLCSMLDWLPGMNRCDISEEDTTRALHALYQSLILNNFQNRGGKESIDVESHIGREVSVKKRKLRDQDCLLTSQSNGDDLGDSDANASEREVTDGFGKQKKSKVFQTEKRESNTSKREEKSRMRGTVTRIISRIKDSPPINRTTVEREHQTKYRVERQYQEELGMIRKQVCEFPRKQAFGYGKEARTCIAI